MFGYAAFLLSAVFFAGVIGSLLLDHDERKCNLGMWLLFLLIPALVAIPYV